ncbi:MAG TPA: hypothetical protein VFW33_16735 [Gemmataceae bacterium]|nr:hypothetical protein [Gemmataceae bacterium]
MEIQQPHERTGEADAATAGQFSGAAEPDGAPAWEQVAAGRYMPRRIRGSYKGRALG